MSPEDTAERSERRDAEALEAEVWQALDSVEDPELHMSVRELGMIRRVAIRDGTVDVELALTVAGCPLRNQIQQAVRDRVGAIPGVQGVTVRLTTMSPDERRRLEGRLRAPILPGLMGTEILVIGSGKGGVGKSTVAANLAAALASRELRVGLLDADVYGFSIPRMLGVRGMPPLVNGRIVPLERDGIRVISMGLFAGDDEAVIWRGPLLHKAIQEFLTLVEWRELDYLLIDLPPGTGDVPLSLAQLLPRARMIIVTTPQPAAAHVAIRLGRLAEKTAMPVLGVIENMSAFTTPAGEEIAVFGAGGGQEVATALEVPLLGKVPLDPHVREAGDAGNPVAWDAQPSPAREAFGAIADRLVDLTSAQGPGAAPANVHAAGAQPPPPLAERTDAA
jgi:ATP-binding protein involved in chromosome partitioning